MQTGLKARGQCNSSSRAVARGPRPFSSSRAPSTTSSRRQRWSTLARADQDKEPDVNDLKNKFFKSSEQQQPQPSSSDQKGQQQEQGGPNLLDSVNPYQLGRQARQAVNEIWGQVKSVTAPTKSFAFDDVLDMGLDDADAPSSAASTCVLVVGATGRVGRILTRKLLLRGYKVRGLVRRREGMREDAEGVPEAVEIVSGDVGETRDCQRAVRGVDKVRGCGAAGLGLRAWAGGGWGRGGLIAFSVGLLQQFLACASRQPVDQSIPLL
jgi:hypothetical protein